MNESRFIPIDVQAFRAEIRRTVAEVMFQKLDGNLRKMRCTLMPSYLQFSESHQPHLDRDWVGDKDDGKTIAVWDVENNGWRSFRTDRVISMQAVSSQ